ncbi:hypothetical protein [Streptomyces zaomyceticus]|uniref:hypothetical protein n=1 Tax=Streptomyces zaomyceticus TaxID=68286 RepID=UPI001675916A|nr:hypothetical protein [Streptomyces zaomyceticus]GHG29667.1 hypothetical protein GCM10018791_52560 [Streptomyces zaomyceticus]
MAETHDHWQVAYAALDSSTLLALLPVLQAGREKAMEMLKIELRHHEQMEGADVHTAELWGEALVAFDARIAADDPSREKLADLRDKVQQMLGEQAGRTKQAKSETRVHEYLWAHQQREIWIKEELTRRGLLPTF